MSVSGKRNVSRRDFIKGVGAGGAVLTAEWLINGDVSPAYASGLSEDSCGVLIDLTRCTGCGSCCAACK